MHDLAGKICGIILAFVLVIIMPFVNVAVENEMLDRRLIINEITTFIDGVVDSRQITDSMINELNVSLAKYGISVDYDITRYARSVNNDPLSDGDYYVTYMQVDDNTTYRKGDKISVHVYSIGYSGSISLAHRLSGIFTGDLDVILTARIR